MQESDSVNKKHPTRRALFDHIPAMVDCVDSNGILIDVNVHWLKELGYRWEDVVGKPAANVIKPQSGIAEIGKDYDLPVGAPADFRDQPYRYVAKNGARIPMQRNGEAVYDENGAFLYIVGIATGRQQTDTSNAVDALSEDNDLKAKRDELEKAIRAADAANQAKSEYIAVLSHDLRSPVTSVKSAVEMLNYGLGGHIEEKAKDLLWVADEACNRMLFMIDGLLDIDRIEQRKIDIANDELSVQSVISTAARQNAAIADKFSVSLKIVKPAPDDARIIGDDNRLQQVLDNLISNACKYSHEGGVVEIAVDVKDGKALVCVRDYGVGIPEDFRHKVFQPYAQQKVKNAVRQKGTGLGLNIARAIVQMHGGSLWFETETGTGTAFFFDLPLI